MQKILFVDPNKESPISYRMDEGIQFGLGFFETILIREKPYYLEEHTNRLNKSLAHFGMNRVVHTNTVEEFIHFHCLEHTALKLIVTQKNLFGMVRPIPYHAQNYQSGNKVTFSRVIKSRHSPTISHKTLNYGDNILELKRANKSGYDDCLFLNEDGYVTESAIANLFLVQNNELITPPISDGLLPGIIRQKIIEHFIVTESSIRKDQLITCQGAFLTNSLMGALPISHVDEVCLPRHPFYGEVIQFLGTMIPQL